LETFLQQSGGMPASVKEESGGEGISTNDLIVAQLFAENDDHEDDPCKRRYGRCS